MWGGVGWGGGGGGVIQVDKRIGPVTVNCERKLQVRLGFSLTWGFE